MSAAHRASMIEQRLKRFAPGYRANVVMAASRHDRLADLALSFPALLFTIAAPQTGVNAGKIAEMAIAGHSLGEIARLAQLPMWIRKLPPETFARPIPRLPDGELFRRQIANHLPRSRGFAHKWLELAAYAARWSGEDFALWVAKVSKHESDPRKFLEPRLMSLWAWFSLRPDTIGGRMLEVKWRPSLSRQASLKAAENWSSTLFTHFGIGNRETEDTWFTAGEFDGYEFTPLATAASIAEEAIAMRNCLRDFGDCLLWNEARFWSVRLHQQRIAVLRLYRSSGHPIPHIAELKGKDNKEAGKDVWMAAAKWMQSQDLQAIAGTQVARAKNKIDPERWRAVWRPYWLDRRAIPSWLPLRPRRNAMSSL